MQLTGAEIVVECLKEQGVDTVFGYPGGTILNVYDALAYPSAACAAPCSWLVSTCLISEL